MSDNELGNNITRRQGRVASVGAGVDRESSRSVSSRSSTLRLRAEYEAEKELAKVKETLIRKKLALDIAEIDDEEGGDGPRSVYGADRIKEWLEDGQPPSSEQVISRSDPPQVPGPAITHVTAPPAAERKPTQRAPATANAVSGTAADVMKLADVISAMSSRKYKVDLPIFDGDPVDWLNYRRTFESTAANHIEIDNISRIKYSLKGPAKYTVEDLLRTGAAPAEVIQALEEAYGHPNQLLESVLRKVKSLPRVTEGGAELRRMTAAVRNCAYVLKNIKANGYINNPQIINEILGKLTPVQRAQYGEFVMKSKSTGGEDLRISPNLNIVLEFLTHLTLVSSYYQPPNVEPRGRNSASERRDPERRERDAHRVHASVESLEESSSNMCALCDKMHSIVECSVFTGYDEQERWNYVKTNRLCFKCLRQKHSRYQCRAKRCAKCRAPHHTLLHFTSSGASRAPAAPAQPRAAPSAPVHGAPSASVHGAPSASVQGAPSAPVLGAPPAPIHGAPSAPMQGASSALLAPAGDTMSRAAPAAPRTAASAATRATASRAVTASGHSTESVTSMGERYTKSLLKVIPITITFNRVSRECYALLDDGATVSLIDSKLSEELCKKNDNCNLFYPLRVISASGHVMTDNKSCKLNVFISGPSGQQYNATLRTINVMDLPPQTVPAYALARNAHLKDLTHCAMSCAKPMILLGQDNWELIVNQEIRKGRSGQPVASLTKLGWVVHGPLGNSEPASESVNLVSEIDNNNLYELVKNQFELESLGITEVNRKNVESERACKVLENTSRRIDSGWEVGLLWSRDEVHLPDNYDYAVKRLHGVENKMNKDPVYAAAYSAQIDRLISEKYARLVDSPMKANPVWWLPHFGVTNPNKPGKLRLVYDAAAKYQNTCLNDHLLSGPDLLNSLLGVLFKFRAGPIAYTGDIADMFLRIKIRKEDQGAQLFLWRGLDRSRDPKTYVMDSMIFGAKSSPTSAIYILNKNASEFVGSYSEAVKAIHDRHYMDDYLDSRNTVEEARQLIRDVTMIHAAGGFTIRGWVTNSPELRQELPVVTPTKVNLERSPIDGERTLGMIWIPETDELAFDLSFKRLPPEIIEGRIVPSKRDFLRFVMSIFDPLGLLCPYTIKSKILLQQVWRSGIGWDEKLKEKEFKEWGRWLQDIKQLTNMRVPRWYRLNGASFELHVFGDASELAYSAVAFLVSYDESGNPAVAMVAGKGRVAPLKVVSVPRLELQAAVLACRLANTVEKEQDVAISCRYLWSDSKTVLKWIHADPRDFQKFVSHRLAEIDRKSNTSEWRWVPSADNPADEATKMYWPTNSKLWLRGPDFLYQSKDRWPLNEYDDGVVEKLERIEKVNVVKQFEPLVDVSRFSSWTRAVRATARVLSFVGICRKKQSEALTVDNIRDAETLLIKQSQAEAFPQELSGSVKASSKIRQLDPFVYEGDGLLRVRGRLMDAPDLSFDERHPIVLDGRSVVAQLILDSQHRRMCHANHETVLNTIREKFWITRLRQTFKSVVSKCQFCRVRGARPVPPKMGDLPLVRLENTRRAFVNCGIDYFGPMEVAIGRRREKRWGVIFTCLATRAIHLEIAASLSADSAIMAIRRFIARRGQPAIMLSDRGTNFIRADKEIREFALTKGIEWRFNPPAAPHMGGCWERLIRSVKSGLKVILNERAPREEILQTLFAEVELIINSRPLTYISADSEGPIALTPNHLLLGTASGVANLGSFEASDLDGRKAWRKAQALADMFWRRWLREYIPTLQKRQKWHNNVSPIKIGDVVLICDKNQPRNSWPRGVVSAVHPGRDGQVRVVTVKTACGQLLRPVIKVAVLPTDDGVCKQGGGM